MTLRLYNTLTRQKEEFKPLDPANVRMYVCGPTVYDFAHIGNARPVIVFDVLYRLLKHLYPGVGKASDGSRVEYVRNITDVDDKINARALRDFPNLPLNDAIAKVTEKTANQFQGDVKALGCLEPTVQPRATDNIAGMISMIQSLLDRKYAYVAQGEDGREALFDVKMMRDYGKLSGRKQEEQKAGARVAIERHKRNPADFVLWKESKTSEPGWDGVFQLTEENQNELQLNSPNITIFGRPGWHIECSAMSSRYLGEVFDIHGGGLDLIFPHHENEIAQSRCCFGTDVMANVWMHNGFLQVEGKKMSKSDGNFVTIADVLMDWPGEVARFNMLRTHYRQPIDWTYKSLEESRRTWVSMGNAIRDYLPSEEQDELFLLALLDDLNTHEALARCEKLLGLAQKGETSAARLLRRNLETLGFFGNFKLNFNLSYSEDELEDHPDQVLGNVALVNGDFDLHTIAKHLDARYPLKSANTTNLLKKFVPGTLVRDARSALKEIKVIKQLDGANTEARAAKDYVKADQIRKELDGKSLVIRINKDGTTSWEVKR
jgi:cysteinyl-tRNA synthetase